MQAEFHYRREQKNRLEYGRVRNPNRSVHFHSQLEVYFVVSGAVEVWINDKRRVLRAGEIAVAFSYDAHGYRSVEESEAVYLIVPTDLLHDFQAMLNERCAGDPFISDESVFRRIYAAFCELETGGSALLTRGYVYVILGTLLERLPMEERREAVPSQLSARFLLYVNEHYRRELTLGELASVFGYNASYLSRSFRETFGVTFKQYLTMIRLREAILLLHEGRSITESALESGFGSLRNFYRSFESKFGCTPREYLEAECHAEQLK